MRTLGIAGSGTMGAGIARAAAAATFPVLLTDTDPAALKAAMQRIAGGLERLASGEKMGARDATAAFHRIQPCKTLKELADADLIVEAGTLGRKTGLARTSSRRPGRRKR